MTDEAMIEAVAKVICKARCSPERPDPGKGLDEFIAQAVHALYLPVIEKARREALEQAAGVAEAFRQRATVAGANNGPDQVRWSAAAESADQIVVALRSLPVGDE